MTVARRLQGAFVAFVALIGIVVALQVRTIRSATESSRALAAISSRLRVTSTEQVARLGQMRDDAEKFLVTNEVAYLDRATASSRMFGSELARLNAGELSRRERSALVRVATEWRSVAPMAGRLAELPGRPRPAIEPAVARFQQELDRVEDKTLELGAASQAAMADELQSVESAAEATKRISLTAAVLALILMIAMSAHLVRTIVGPLGRLAEGTRQVSAGHFDHRLDANGDDELAQVARDFNSMTERLGELDRLKRDFVAKVSHDLKTPLSSMQETTSAVLDGVVGPVSESQRRLLALNLESSQRLASMLSKLLDLSRIEARLEPTREVVDLQRVVAGSVSRIATSEFGPRVLVVGPGAPLIVRGDPYGLGQLVDNLLENALKFSPPDGTVTIRIESFSSAVMLTVTDEGLGVPDAEKERIFERFYQAGAGRAVRGRGAGLGLAICREIVSAHGGRIRVSDNAPRGSVFCVSLPPAGAGDQLMQDAVATAGAAA